VETVIQTLIPIHHVQKKIFADGYDENYRGDANDRAWLKTLSEREREAELLKRHELREIIKRREEINKRLKSKAEESGIKSEEEGEIDDHDDDSDNEKANKNSIRKSNLFDNDIYAEVMKMIIEYRQIDENKSMLQNKKILNIINHFNY